MTIGTAIPVLVAQGAAALHDTLIVRPLPPVRSTFDQLVYVASGLTAILTLLLVVALVIGLLAMRRAVQRAHDAFDQRLQEFGRRVDDFNALLGRVRNQADRVVELTGSAITGVEWGADKLKDMGTRRRRRRKPRGDTPGGNTPDGQAPGGNTPGRGGSPPPAPASD